MSVSVSSTCIFMNHVYAWGLMTSAELKTLGPLELEMVMSSLCRCWKLNPVPLQQQSLLVTVEPSLHLYYPGPVIQLLVSLACCLTIVYL